MGGRRPKSLKTDDINCDDEELKIILYYKFTNFFTHTSFFSSDKKKKPISEDEMEMGMLPPMWEPSPKQKEPK